MDRILQAPPKHRPPSSDLAEDADVDAEEASRKRARIEARRKFRIVTTTILATNRFRCVVDVEAEQPEQAESEIIAAFGALEIQSSSEEMVDSSITKNQTLTYSSAGGELISEPNSTNIGSFPTTNQGYCTTGLGDGTALSDDLFSDPLSIHEWSKEGEEWSLPSLEVFQEPEECPADEDSLYSAAGLVWEGDDVMEPLPETGLSDSLITDYLLSLDSQDEKEKATSSTDGRMLINEDDDVLESGQHEQEREESSEDSLQNLWKIEENSKDWGIFVTRVIDMISKRFQDLEPGSGRDKVHQLAEDAREITKKFETIKGTEQRLSGIFEELQKLLKDLSQNVHGRQRQLAQSMSRLIKDGCRAVETQKRHTTTVSGKLDTHATKLGKRELSVEKHLNKCAASITTSVKSALEKEKENFTSVDSVRKWHSDERSRRQSLAEFSSDPYPFLPVL